MVADPLVELADSISKVTTSRLSIKVAVRVWVAIVQDIVTDNHTRTRKKIVLQNKFYVPLILGFIGIHKNHVELPFELWQRLQRRTYHHFMSTGHFWKWL